MKTEIVDLECRYDSRNSFYGQALVEDYYTLLNNDEDDTIYNRNVKVIKLWSYDTLVCVMDKRKSILYVDYPNSMTTNRHIIEFLNQNFGHNDLDLWKRDLLKRKKVGVFEVKSLKEYKEE